MKVTGLLFVAASVSEALIPSSRSARVGSTAREAVLGAPRKDDAWYQGLSTNLGASGKLPAGAAAFAEKVQGGAQVEIADTLAMIEKDFTYAPVTFSIGELTNEAGVNEGSAKILSYAILANLGKDTTLELFGQPYRDVVANPEGSDHGNVRALMANGVEAVRFPNGLAITAKLIDEDEEYTSDKGLKASSKIGEGDDWDVDSDIWIPVDGVEM